MTTKSPQGHRGGKKKRGQDFDPTEHLTPPPVTWPRKARKSSNNQQGSHQNQGSPLDTDRLMQTARQDVQPLIVDGRDVLPRFDEIVFSIGIRAAHKVAMLHAELRQIVDLQEKKSQAEIASLKQDTQFASADRQVARTTLKRQNDALQMHNDELKKINENLRLELSRFPIENLEAGVNSGHEIERGFHNRLNRNEQLNAISGSYTDDSATPNLLANVFNDTKTVVTRFQKELFKAFKLTERDPWDLLRSDQIVFARENHLGFYLKSFLNEMFFEGFENESFKVKNGVSKFLDPNLRQTMFYEYYRNSTGDIDDPHFREFWGAKYSSFWELFPLNNGNNRKVCYFEELGGFELGLQLGLSFKEAVKSVWLLHKLAFSFEPPASIFRVEQGVDVNSTYMDAIVMLEDDQRFVNKVGFMVTPGLRIRKTVMRCEVYLGGSADRRNSQLGHADGIGGKQHWGRCVHKRSKTL